MILDGNKINVVFCCFKMILIIKKRKLLGIKTIKNQKSLTPVNPFA